MNLPILTGELLPPDPDHGTPHPDVITILPILDGDVLDDVVCWACDGSGVVGLDDYSDDSILPRLRRTRDAMSAAETIVCCPWCPMGTLRIEESSTEQHWLTGFHIIESGVGFETRERRCLIAACNACEFVVEIDRDGNVVPAKERVYES